MSERDKIVAFMRDAVDSGYPWPRPRADECEHGRFGWEDCIACYDEHLHAKLNAVEAGEHLKRPSPTIKFEDWRDVPSVGYGEMK